MNEEELKAKAAELEAKAAELERKEGELKEKETQLNEREEQLSKREADAHSIAEALKEEFEKKLEAQKEEYEDRLKQRDEVIRQLASGERSDVDENSPFAELNKRRIAQKAA